jgi:quercetin dioxygenase-like cupin family protein
MMPEEPGPVVGQPVSTVSLVDVQSGAVVSREVISKPQGTVSVFAFDEGEGLSEHTAPFDALVLALEGRVEVTIGGEPHGVAEGEMIIMPAHVPHALKALTPFKMMLVLIRA